MPNLRLKSQNLFYSVEFGPVGSRGKFDSWAICAQGGRMSGFGVRRWGNWFERWVKIKKNSKNIKTKSGSWLGLNRAIWSFQQSVAPNDANDRASLLTSRLRPWHQNLRIWRTGRTPGQRSSRYFPGSCLKCLFHFCCSIFVVSLETLIALTLSWLYNLSIINPAQKPTGTAFAHLKWVIDNESLFSYSATFALYLLCGECML